MKIDQQPPLPVKPNQVNHHTYALDNNVNEISFGKTSCILKLLEGNLIAVFFPIKS
jgi:hypothetical protein